MVLIKLIFITILFLVYSCSDPANSSDTNIDEIEHKEYTLDSSGNILHTEMQVSDFTSSTQCMECHQQHYEEWSSSFHAHSFDDPLFMSMWFSEKEHRPSTGVNYCIQCHAPAAFLSNYNLDGVDSQVDLNDPDIPMVIKEGVSCDICHTMVGQSRSVFTQDNVAAVAEYYLNPGENIKYGSIENPAQNDFHGSMYKPLYSSSFSCKPCHDQFIRGMPIEATVSEWESNAAFNMGGPSCQDCHMKKQADGHSSHYFAGVDLLFYDGVNSSSPAYSEVVEILQEAVTLSFSGDNEGVSIGENILNIPVTVNNRTGHNMPSGTPFSREAWLEVIVATSNGDTLFSVGNIANDDTLDYQNQNLMFFTAILYDQDNQQGNIVYEPSNALSYTNHSLKIGMSESKTYSINLLNTGLESGDALHINTRMLFRAFKPQMLDQFHTESVQHIPIITMSTNDTIFTIP